MARRYRVHFNASFAFDIEAEDADDARAIAGEMAANPTTSMIAAHRDLRCSWSTITPLTPAGIEAEDG